MTIGISRPEERPAAASQPVTAISVVICSYTLDRWDDLRAAVGSLHRQTMEPAEIIVVIDNNAELLRMATREWPRARVMASAGPAGVSAARNTGLHAARGDVVGFLDDDAVAAADWIARMAAALDDPQVLAAGGTVAARWETQRPQWFPSEFDWVVGCTYRGMPKTPTPVRNLIGASMAVRRVLLAEIGGFSTSLGRIGRRPTGCEETEACIRLSRARPNGRLLFDPSIRVEHSVPVARTTLRYFLARCYLEGRSKAVVARLVGKDSALATERDYVRGTLSRGVWRSISRSLAERRASALSHGGVIIIGLGVTLVGYLRGRFEAGRGFAR